jgi:membrane associated rhomboid family serine protease
MTISGPPHGGQAGPAADPVPRTCYRHPDRTTYVSCVRCDRPICAECMRPASVGFQCPDDVAAGAKQQRPLRNQFGVKQVYARAYVTFTMLAINVIVFILQGFPITQSASNKFTNDYVSWNYYIAHDHQYYRLLTGAFLHVAIWHIGLNMLVLLMVGPALEKLLGPVRFTALYLLAGIGGNVLPFLVDGYNTANLGASGAIYGLFAAYWVIARRLRADTSAITGTIVLNLVLTVTIPGISLWGHVGGLIVGAVIGAVFAYSGAKRWHLQLAGVVGVAVILVIATVIRTATIYIPPF